MRDEAVLFEALAAFQRMRREGREALTRFVRRLEHETAQLPSGSNEGGGVATLGGTKRPRGDPLDGLLAVGRDVVRLVPLVPAWLAQKRALRRLRDSNGEATIVAISATRLYQDCDEEPRAYLASLAESLPRGFSKLTARKMIAEAPTLLLCDPARVSLLWRKKSDCWRDSIFIADSAFLCFLAAFALPSVARRLARLWQARRQASLQPGSAQPSDHPSLKQLVAAAVLAEGYRLIAGGFARVEGLFFTSNSFATELLRVRLLPDDRCRSVVEVLHGVPTVEFERYMSAILALTKGPDGEKHSFIAQLPELPLYGAFRRLGEPNEAEAVNTFLNRYVLQKGSDLRPESIEAECRRLFPAGLPVPGTRIVAFTGGANHDNDFLGSPSFRAERVMMRTVRRVLDNINVPHVLIYTPHPAHDPASFMRHPFFAEQRIVVHPRGTILTWFIADECLSLVSSALFEAAYFGARTFTPLRPEDEIYPASLCELLGWTAGTDQAGFLAALERFLLSDTPSAEASLRDKIGTRLALLASTAATRSR